jgi:hypothetical protein
MGGTVPDTPANGGTDPEAGSELAIYEISDLGNASLIIINL